MASISAVYADPDGTVWIGSNEGLFSYKPGLDIKNYDLDFNCLIRKVMIGNDSVLYWGNETQSGRMYTPGIDYQYNNLKFYFAAPFFDQEENLRYSCYLEGFDENWSPWTNSPFKEYTKVREGRYTFNVKAINIYGKESPVAHYRVRVLPPWYRTVFAYSLYAFALLVLLIFSLRIYARILVKQKRRLESTVEERTREILKQKDAMQSQAEEMAAQSEELQEKAEILRKINEELEKLSIVASETDNAIAIMDEKGQFLWINDGFTRLYGYSPDEYFSMYSNIFETVRSDEIIKLIRQSLETRQSVLFETRVDTKAGKRLFIQSTITPITGPNGKIDKLVAIDSDITRLKEAEWEIIKKSEQITAQKEELEQHRNHLEQIVKKRTEELEIAKNKAEESDRLKSAFLANMSHEIRTPMNAIIGFSNLLVNPDIPGEQKDEFAHLIIQSGNSLLQLIEDIIDIAKIEAGQLKIVSGICNLALLLAELYEFFRQRIQIVYNKDIRLALQIPNSHKSLQIRTDQLRLKQVFTNLIENAIKFTNKGLIECGFHVLEEGGQAIIRFYVKDSGIGMTEKEQQIIFERFTKIETDRTRLYRGAGLGLAISKNIVEMLGGELKVESEVNKGSEFYFGFPLEESGLAENKPLKPEGPVYQWNNKTILVAEDEDSNFRFIEVFLSPTGVKIVRAIDGKDVLEKFEKGNFDLLLMDIKMPVMDGLEATREIRKKNQEIPVIALTAYAMQNDEQECLQAGCNAFISKPVDQVKMMETLGQWLGIY
jgi:PAS domain S-box-containing protein